MAYFVWIYLIQGTDTNKYIFLYHEDDNIIGPLCQYTVLNAMTPFVTKLAAALMLTLQKG